jgi:1-deoxy-D-xylulose-5-phosphate reductoisomerase
LAFEAMKKGGNMACAMNAANEIAVASFLKEEIKYLEIPDLIEKVMNSNALLFKILRWKIISIPIKRLES